MADNTIAITAGSGTNVRTITNAGVDGGAHQQVVSLADAAGNTIGTTATPMPVQVQGDPDSTITGTLSATDAVVAAPTGNGALLTGTPTANSAITLAAPGGDSSFDVQLSGTFGSGTVYFEGSFDGGTSFLPLNTRQTGIINTVLGYSTTTAGAYRGNTSGVSHLRVRIVGATAPSVAVTIRLAAGVGAIFLNASLPAGTNAIGSVVANPPPSQYSTITTATNGIGTLTLPAPGAGLFHYITKVVYQRFQITANTPAATLLLTGGTNHTMQWYLPNDNAALGTAQVVVDFTPGTPVKVNAANTATTFVSPAVTSAQYKIMVTYYIAA